MALDRVHGFVSEEYSADVFSFTDNRANFTVTFIHAVKPFKPLVWPLLILTVFSAVVTTRRKSQAHVSLAERIFSCVSVANYYYRSKSIR